METSHSPVEAATSDPSSNGSNHRPFGAALEPVLRSGCEDRLSEIRWFRTDWQRGGALTGYATFQTDDDGPQEVVVKLPIPPVERRWLAALQSAHNDVAPRVFAHGDRLGGYDMCWVVMERLHHGPLGAAWGGKEFDLLVDAVVRFYEAAEAQQVASASSSRTLAGARSISQDWHAVLKKSRDHVKTHDVANAQRWNKALKKAGKKIDGWVEAWDARSLTYWCHGDLHLGNGLTRQPAPDGPALLIDFAHTRPGHWIEDAIYFEHLFWGKPQRLDGRTPAKLIARQRKNVGLPVDADWADLARVRRTLLALSAPARLPHECDAAHLQASLDILETEIH